MGVLSNTVHEFPMVKALLTSGQAYAVTKSAQIHLVKCLAVIASPNIRVNCVSPSMMLTVSVFLASGLFPQLTRANKAAGLECRFPSSEESCLDQENETG